MTPLTPAGERPLAAFQTCFPAEAYKADIT
jgi:hypothetical protein